MKPHLDPDYITKSDWEQIGDLLLYLGAVPIMVIGFAFSLLLARAIIPSLVDSGHLSRKIYQIRVVFYGVSAVSLSLLVWVTVNLLDLLGVLENFYYRWLI
jgi:hypothetical protein